MGCPRTASGLIAAFLLCLTSCTFSNVGSDATSGSSGNEYAVHIRRVTISSYAGGSTVAMGVPASTTNVTVNLLTMGGLSVLYTLGWDDASLFSYAPSDYDSTYAGCQPVMATTASSFSFYFTPASDSGGKDAVFHVSKYVPSLGLLFSTDTFVVHIASWCTLTLDPNGGIAATSSLYGYEGTALSLSSSSATLSGFTLAGWNTAADGSGTAWASNGTVTLPGNLTLYAQWAPNTWLDGNLTYTFDSASLSYTASSYASTASASSVAVLSSIKGYKVSALGSGLFQSHAEISSVVIPASVSAIGDYAFSSCSNLVKVVFGGSTPPVLGGTNVFASCSSSLIFYVPAAALGDYAASLASCISAWGYTVQGN